jgi:hypothetical protein
MVQLMSTTDDLPRKLTAHERALIEQSKEDFKAGRSYSLDEARAQSDQVLAKLGVAPTRTRRMG